MRALVGKQWMRMAHDRQNRMGDIWGDLYLEVDEITVDEKEEF